MSDKHILRTLRQQAWERAKGELQAMLSTYWANDEGFDELYEEVERFIKKVEGEGLQE